MCGVGSSSRCRRPETLELSCQVWENLGDAPQIPVFKAHTDLRKTTLLLTLKICTETQDGGKGRRTLLMSVLLLLDRVVRSSRQCSPPQSSPGTSFFPSSSQSGAFTCGESLRDLTSMLRYGEIRSLQCLKVSLCGCPRPSPLCLVSIN